MKTGDVAFARRDSASKRLNIVSSKAPQGAKPWSRLLSPPSDLRRDCPWVAPLEQRDLASKDVPDVTGDSAVLPVQCRKSQVLRPLQAMTGSQAGLGQPSMNRSHVGSGVVNLLDDLDALQDGLGIKGCISAMDSVCDQGTRIACRRSNVCKADPHLPIFGVLQTRVEWRHLL